MYIHLFYINVDLLFIYNIKLRIKQEFFKTLSIYRDHVYILENFIRSIQKLRYVIFDQNWKYLSNINFDKYIRPLEKIQGIIITLLLIIMHRKSFINSLILLETQILGMFYFSLVYLMLYFLALYDLVISTFANISNNNTCLSTDHSQDPCFRT